MCWNLLWCNRKDVYNCYARVEFQAANSTESAVCLISCAGGTEDSAVGAKLKLCYSHNDPSKDALVTQPVSRIPREDRFRSLGRCAPVTFDEALKCRQVFYGVLYAFVACCLLVVLLCFFTVVCYRCKACFERRRIVIPDPSMELTSDHFWISWTCSSFWSGFAFQSWHQGLHPETPVKEPENLSY